MASIHKDPRGKSKYFYCAYKAADGRRLFRTTKKTDRTKALQFCLDLERAEQEASEGRLTEARARELIADTVKRTSGRTLECKQTGVWLDEWFSAKEKSQDLSETSKISYSHAIRVFKESIGDKLDQNIAHITPEDIQNFKNARIATGLTAKTVDRNLKIIRSIFKAAKDQGHISFDPTQAIPLISKKSRRKLQTIARETFTADELDLIINAAEGDWKTAIFIGRYLGARLSDCVSLTWENVDLNKSLIQYSDLKTGKDYKIPIHTRLEKHLLKIASNDDPKGLLCPTLAKKKSGGNYGLSREFRRIMAKADVDDRQVKTKAVKAMPGKERYLSCRSFHSIRHTYNSQLANAGTSQEVRRKLVGHSSDDMNDIYTHLDDKLFRKAIKKLA